MEFWMQRKKAIEYAAPDEIDIQLKGLSHEHTVKVNTDDPLCIALASYCASTSGTLAVTSSEVILREYGGDELKFIDAQTTSARMRFYGYSPLKLEVVYRDTSRTEREIESIQGTIPEGYQQFLGAGYVRGFVFDVSFLLILIYRNLHTHIASFSCSGYLTLNSHGSLHKIMVLTCTTELATRH